MKLTLEEAKAFLRVDSSDEDESVIAPLTATAKQMVKDIVRSDADIFDEDDAEEEVCPDIPIYKAAAYHALAYLYEHREEADMNGLTLSLRSILAAQRKAVF